VLPEKFGLFFFDQITLLLRDRKPLLKNYPIILAPLHQGIQYIKLEDEI
jgi:hypothetical protein